MKKLIFSALFCASAAAAQQPEVNSNLTNPKLMGKATGSFLSVDIFDAELWVPEGYSFSLRNKFALTLRYKYNFSAKMLAAASIREMARMEARPKSDFEGLRTPLEACFADVEAGDAITGIASSSNSVQFYVNQRKSCTLDYPNIRQRFFSIWLGPKTRDPAGSAKLQGRG